jgi:hypothetical protein
MKIRKFFTNNFIRLGCAIIVSSLAIQVSASNTRYNMNWEGQNGYSVSGYFSYDNETAGSTVLGEELSDYYLQAFDPQNNALGEFTFDDINSGSLRFHFTFDTVGGRILLTGENDPNNEHELSSTQVFWGFTVGRLSNTSGDILLSSKIGCGTSFPGEGDPELDLYIYTGASGGCSSSKSRVDTGPVGSEISVTLVPVVTASKEFVAIASLPDIDNSGYPEVAVLAVSADDQVMVYIQDTSTGLQIKEIVVSDRATEEAPIDLVVQPDSNGNGYAELLVLGNKADGVGVIRIIDTGPTESILGTVRRD